MATQPLREYVYVDETRLSSYCAQIQPGQSRLDKVSTISSSFGLTGPRVDIGQGKVPRKMELNERVELLLGHLQKTDAVSKNRPIGNERFTPEANSKRFRHEICDAARVVIPRQRVFPFGKPQAVVDGGSSVKDIGSESHKWTSLSSEEPPLFVDFPGITFWVSEETELNGQLKLAPLYLMLDDVRDDEDGAPAISSYSVLEMFGVYINRLIHKTLLGADREEKTVRTRLTCDPIQYLQSLGCVKGGVRRVETLFRIRESFVDDANPTHPVTTFSYPIFIAAI